MSDMLKRLYAQQQRFSPDRSVQMYGEIVKMVGEAMTAGPARKWDGKLFKKLADAIYDYGLVRKERGFWEGAASAHTGLIRARLEMAEEEQASEYAEDAAKSGQIEMTLPPDPDDKYSVIERSGTG